MVFLNSKVSLNKITLDTNLVLGENIVKGVKGAKVKVLFQGLHMTHFIFVF
jgi:hypothetical protein